jgi:hypothetical protein
MVQDLKCPKCQNEMVQGFIPDYRQGQYYVNAWVEGQPKSSLVFHTKVPIGGGMPIAAFRCKGCGYLELYADDKYTIQ